MSVPLNLLLVEDQPSDAALILRVLRAHGFEVQYDRVMTEEEFRGRLDASRDVIISDFSLPQFGAPQALEITRASGLPIPFIVVSGTIGEETAVEIMKRGATDYLLKDRLARLGIVVETALQARREAEERARMAAALAAAEARYRSIFENALEGIYRAAPDGTMIAVNPALARALGYMSPEDLLQEVGRSWSQVYVEPDRREAMTRRLFVEGEVSDFEGRARRSDRTEVWISENVRLVRDEQGTVVAMDGIVQDITQRKSTERRLSAQYALNTALASAETLAEANREVLRILCEALSWDVGAVWQVDAQSRSLRCVGLRQSAEVQSGAWERACTEITLGPSLGLPGRVWSKARPLWIRDVASERGYLRAEGAARAGLHAALAFPVREGDEVTFVFEFLSREVRDPNPETLELAESVAGQLALFLRRRQAEEAVEVSRQQFLQLAESIHEVFWLASPDTAEILYVSPAYERIWGRSRRSLYENPRSFLEAVHPDDLPALRTALDSRRSRGRFQAEYRIVRPEGSTRWIRDRGFPILDEHGNLLRTAGIAEDITERKDLERRYLQAQKMEAVGQLAGGVAHDFNNLLTAMLGFSDLLRETLGPNDPRMEYLEEIVQAGERARGLTRQLLAFSRQQVLEPRVLDLDDVVSGIAAMVKRLIGEHIELECCLRADLGRVRADPGQLEQVIMNLAVNARDAMEDGGRLLLATRRVDLAAGEEADVPAGSYVLLEVADTGCGMSDEVKAHLFEPFFTTKPKGKGTGLGLATSFGIVQQSGGHLVVSSEPGEGTTFRIYLPQVSGGVQAPVTKVRTLLQRGRETILVAEDDEQVRRLASLVLRSLGYHVLEAGDGEEAVGTAADYPGSIALVLTDVVMPRLGGRALAERMQQTHPETRFLFCSGYDEDAMHGSAVAEPSFLQKPFTPAALAAKVREVLDSVARSA